MTDLRQTWPLLLALLVTSACTARDLRGKSLASADGRTYLVVADDNGGSCGQIRVDGADWTHPVGKPGVIEPGTHEISCGDGALTRCSVRPGHDISLRLLGTVGKIAQMPDRLLNKDVGVAPPNKRMHLAGAMFWRKI